MPMQIQLAYIGRENLLALSFWGSFLQFIDLLSASYEMAEFSLAELMSDKMRCTAKPKGKGLFKVRLFHWVSLVTGNQFNVILSL